MHSLPSCKSLFGFLIKPFTARIKSSKPFLWCSRYRNQFCPCFNFTAPPNLSFIWNKQFLSRNSTVISKDAYPFFVIWKQPSPSIMPASHSLKALIFCSLRIFFIFGNKRMASEIPTNMLNSSGVGPPTAGVGPSPLAKNLDTSVRALVICELSSCPHKNFHWGCVP